MHIISIRIWPAFILATVDRRPSFLQFFMYICGACGAQKTCKHTSWRKQGCSSRVPAGSHALSRHVVKFSLIAVLQPDRPCIAGCCFIVTKVGDITPYSWWWLVWMNGCHRNYRYKRNYTYAHTHACSPRYFRFHSWIDLGLSGEFKMWHFHSASVLLFQQAEKKIWKVEAAGGW